MIYAIFLVLLHNSYCIMKELSYSKCNRRWRLNPTGSKAMKKTAFALTIALAAITTMPAYADNASYNWNPYIGADYQRMQYKYNSNDTSAGIALDDNDLLQQGLNGGDLHIGVRPTKNLGAELGYFRTMNESKDIAAGASLGPGVVAATSFSTKVRVQGITLDALGYLPLDKNDTVDLIGTAGVLWNRAESGIVVPSVGSDSEKKSEIDWRIGAGAQVSLTHNVNLRGIVRYQTADFSDVADHAWVYTAGVNYQF